MNVHISPIAITGRSPAARTPDEVLAEGLPADEAVLIPLYEAYRAADKAMQGIFNMPRCGNRAGDMIEEEQERARGYRNAIALKLSQLTSIKEFWTELYLETMLSHCFECGGGASEAAEVIAKFSTLSGQRKAPPPHLAQ